ncbi:putative quinol monooxygenase [Candidatus Halocynthiibacter alkanivorans]|uniref:putative quinol monooxygenase n=1 Tax=Candidatus Halocynthiibacter alkanivorans TaxID=2267619 RepID=UPI000DF45786|nr:putative quinol monooxygenase [Candidatus Halocynthiibacter alkanivorans]
MTNLVLVAHLTVPAAHRDVFLPLVQTLVENSRKDAGCVLYDLHETLENPGAFMIYEIWETTADWQAHDAAPHLARFKEQVASMELAVKLGKYEKLG